MERRLIAVGCICGWEVKAETLPSICFGCGTKLDRAPHLRIYVVIDRDGVRVEHEEHNGD